MFLNGRHKVCEHVSCVPAPRHRPQERVKGQGPLGAVRQLPFVLFHLLGCRSSRLVDDTMVTRIVAPAFVYAPVVRSRRHGCLGQRGNRKPTPPTKESGATWVEFRRANRRTQSDQLLRMPPRRRKKSKQKSPVVESQDVAEALAEKLDTDLILLDSVADAVAGLHGYDLAKKLHQEAVGLFNSGAVDDRVTPDTKDALHLTHELRCAIPGANSLPRAFIPYVVWRKLDQLSTIKGRVDFGDDLQAMTVGKLFVDLTDSCMNRPAENIDIIKGVVDDPLGVLKPFMDIQGLHQVDKYMTTGEMCMLAFLLRNIVPVGINAVSVKPSSLHGNGVFARRSIKKGHIVTMYPCHAFSFAVEGTGTLWAMADGETMLHTTASMFAGYSAEIDPTRIAIAGDPDKHTNDACGHLINDGACILKKDFDVDDVMRYVDESTRKQNCHFIPLGGAALAVVASRDIKAGEEVLAAYGAGFWSKYAHGEI